MVWISDHRQYNFFQYSGQGTSGIIPKTGYIFGCLVTSLIWFVPFQVKHCPYQRKKVKLNFSDGTFNAYLEGWTILVKIPIKPN